MRRQAAHFKLHMVGCLLGLSLLGWTPTAQAGTTYYVATNGDDTRSCSEAQNPSTPKQTMNLAVRCMSAGDTLLIRGGTYYQSIESFSGGPFPSGTSWDNLVTIKGAPGETVMLKNDDPTAYNPRGDLQLCWGESYMSFENLVIERGSFSNACGAGENQDPMPHHIRWKNMEIIGEDLNSTKNES